MNKLAIGLIISIIILITAAIVYIIWRLSKKQGGLKSLNQFVEASNKATPQELETLEIDVLVYDSGLFNSKLNSVYVKTRINNGVVFIEELLDFRKLKMEKPFEPKQIKMTINEEEIKWTESYETVIKLKNVLYVKAYYELSKNALFIEFVLINEEQRNNKFQILNVTDIVNMNNIILKFKNQ
ncbi:hypothetical protein [Spiroplasma endosymbiont of Othius punctulatus]|uniref:hypothetical protein n=1 Tax=Spiroplasma endosymbiont of Othius punctulatus TaxID=3066289 RepID=UPI0030D08DD9